MKDEASIILDKLEKWYVELIEMLPNIAISILVLLGAFYFSKLVRYLFEKIILKKWNNHELKTILGKIVQIVALSVGVLFALSLVNLDKTVTSILAGIGVIGLALGFAFQDIAANFISGVFMASKKPFEIGDIIEVGGYKGKVRVINLRTTEIVTFDGNDVIIPNKDVFQNPITNFSTTPEIRVDVAVGVAYDSDLTMVKKMTIDCIKKIDGVKSDKEPEVFYKEFGDSSINLDILFWIPYGKNGKLLEIKSNVIEAVQRLYRDNGINIPFPIRTLNISKNKDES